MQSVPITIDFVSSNLDQGKLYNIYVIMFVSDLWQVGGFLWVLLFPPQIKVAKTITDILLKVALNTKKSNLDIIRSRNSKRTTNTIDKWNKTKRTKQWSTKHYTKFLKIEQHQVHKKWEITQVLREDRQFLLHLWHLSCCC